MEMSNEKLLTLHAIILKNKFVVILCHDPKKTADELCASWDKAEGAGLKGFSLKYVRTNVDGMSIRLAGKGLGSIIFVSIGGKVRGRQRYGLRPIIIDSTGIYSWFVNDAIPASVNADNSLSSIIPMVI